MVFDQYLDIPFKSRGRDKAGADCWGLARIVAAEQFGINLPMMSADYSARNRHDCARVIETLMGVSGCRPVFGFVPEPGDLVLMDTAGDAVSHIGICVQHGKVLHTEFPHGPRIESATKLLPRIVGVYRADRR